MQTIRGLDPPHTKGGDSMYDTPPPGPLAANAASRLAADDRRGPHNGSRRLDPVPVPVPMPAAPPGARMGVAQLRRFQWAVRAALTVGVAASVCANVLHALDNPISQAIAAWPPLALLLTVELISRVPVHRRSLAYTRLVATATIAGIAAWVSYWHMAGVAARYGETGASAYLLPLSVDGLIVVASICLVELGGRIAAMQANRDRLMEDGHERATDNGRLLVTDNGREQITNNGREPVTNNGREQITDNGRERIAED